MRRLNLIIAALAVAGTVELATAGNKSVTTTATKVSLTDTIPGKKPARSLTTPVPGTTNPSTTPYPNPSPVPAPLPNSPSLTPDPGVPNPTPNPGVPNPVPNPSLNPNPTTTPVPSPSATPAPLGTPPKP